MDGSKIFITGANGQLGTALRTRYPNARYTDISQLDITDRLSVDSYDWSGVEVIINAAAYTNVDGAETPDGRVTCWNVNAIALKNISHIAQHHNMTVLHISTDYVFDGTQDKHTEDEPFSPLSVYGASKAAGDLLVSLLDKHYILRTSWVIGEGKNFVRTMLDLGKQGINPTVVADQIGRLTFTSELVRAIDYMLIKQLAFGTYNVTNSGEPASWAEVTRKIYKLANLKNKVSDTTTTEYYHDKDVVAPRPLKSTLSLEKLHATGFTSVDWHVDLENYIKKELSL